jgi:hypothetical protein
MPSYGWAGPSGPVGSRQDWVGLVMAVSTLKRRRGFRGALSFYAARAQSSGSTTLGMQRHSGPAPA